MGHILLRAARVARLGDLADRLRALRSAHPHATRFRTLGLSIEVFADPLGDVLLGTSGRTADLAPDLRVHPMLATLAVMAVWAALVGVIEQLAPMRFGSL